MRVIAHVYLGGDVTGVLAHVHRPEGEPSRGSVLVCPPFGWEDVSSYRVRREWAEHLAARGHTVLRFDPPGSGDSIGSPRDPGQLAAWTAAATTAACWLRQEPGAPRVTALGLGLGGMVAWQAAAAGAPIDDLVLWGAVSQGRRALRELRAFAALDARAAERDAGRDADGVLEVAGHVLTAETQSALEALDLTASPLPGGSDRRVLVLDRDGLPGDPRLVAAARESGAQVSLAPGPGFAAMTSEPRLARAPREVTATLDAWLAAAPAEAAAPHLRADVRADESADAGGGVREAPLDVEYPRGYLAGVLTTPTGPHAPVCAVFLNAGAIRRIGPNRMWVEAARRWARAGVPSLRLDIEGLGDADGDAEAYGDIGQFYVPHLADQVTAALNELEHHGLGPRYLVVGLCSGAFMGFHAAIGDPRVCGVVMLNTQILHWNPAIELARSGRMARRFVLKRRRLRSVLRPSLIRAEVPMLLRVTRGWLRDLPRRLASRADSRPDAGQLSEALDRLQASGAHVAMAFSAGEPLPEELAGHPLFTTPGHWPAVTVEPLPGGVHELRSLEAQAHAHGLLDRELERLIADNR